MTDEPMPDRQPDDAPDGENDAPDRANKGTDEQPWRKDEQPYAERPEQRGGGTLRAEPPD